MDWNLNMKYPCGCSSIWGFATKFHTLVTKLSMNWSYGCPQWRIQWRSFPIFYLCLHITLINFYTTFPLAHCELQFPLVTTESVGVRLGGCTCLRKLKLSSSLVLLPLFLNRSEPISSSELLVSSSPQLIDRSMVGSFQKLVVVAPFVFRLQGSSSSLSGGLGSVTFFWRRAISSQW